MKLSGNSFNDKMDKYVKMYIFRVCEPGKLLHAWQVRYQRLSSRIQIVFHKPYFFLILKVHERPGRVNGSLMKSAQF